MLTPFQQADSFLPHDMSINAPSNLKKWFQKIGRLGGKAGTKSQKSKAGNASSRARNIKRFTRARLWTNVQGIRVITCGCETKTIAEWAKKLGVPERSFRQKITDGQPVSKVLINTLG
jgi:hypothetical protein